MQQHYYAGRGLKLKHFVLLSVPGGQGDVHSQSLWQNRSGEATATQIVRAIHPQYSSASFLSSVYTLMSMPNNFFASLEGWER